MLQTASGWKQGLCDSAQTKIFRWLVVRGGAAWQGSSLVSIVVRQSCPSTLLCSATAYLSCGGCGEDCSQVDNSTPFVDVTCVSVLLIFVPGPRMHKQYTNKPIVTTQSSAAADDRVINGMSLLCCPGPGVVSARNTAMRHTMSESTSFTGSCGHGSIVRHSLAHVHPQWMQTSSSSQWPALLRVGP